jgi:C4-type Zn-finger protein
MAKPDKELKECPCCQRMQPNVKTRPRNTSYANEKLNWLESCEECYIQDREYFRDMWIEYYQGRL